MPGYNQYVGMRYVPIIDGEWSQSKAYEPLVVVVYNGNSYISKTYVPAGTLPTNETYWILAANYNAQVEQYRQEVRQYQQTVDEFDGDITEIDGKVTTLEGSVESMGLTVNSLNTAVTNLNQENHIIAFSNQYHAFGNVSAQSSNGASSWTVDLSGSQPLNDFKTRYPGRGITARIIDTYGGNGFAIPWNYSASFNKDTMLLSLSSDVYNTKGTTQQCGGYYTVMFVADREII